MEIQILAAAAILLFSLSPRPGRTAASLAHNACGASGAQADTRQAQAALAPALAWPCRGAIQE